MNTSRIQERVVLHFSGYEEIGAEHHYQRFIREGTHFQNLWGVRQDTSKLENHDGVASWHTITQGPDWSVATKLILMEWCSFLGEAHKHSFWRRIRTSVPCYIAQYFSFDPWRYFRANWRYGLFFMYPIIVTMAIALMSFAPTWALNRWAGNLSNLQLIAISFIIFLAAFRFFGERWNVLLTLELMHHIHSLALRNNNFSTSRLDTFSAVLRKELQTSTADEVTITAHSLGSTYAVATIARLLRTNPELLKKRKVSITAIGSNLLQIGLMSQGDWLRDDLTLVLGQNNIQWIEIYAANDPICFYKTGPDTVISDQPANALISRRVRFSRMLEQRRYKRIRSDFLRLHRQLIMANEHRYFYDFYLLLFGPLTVVEMLQRDPATDL